MAGQPIGSVPPHQGEGRADHPQHTASLHARPGHTSAPTLLANQLPKRLRGAQVGNKEHWTPRAGPPPPFLTVRKSQHVNKGNTGLGTLGVPSGPPPAQAPSSTPSMGPGAPGQPPRNLSGASGPRRGNRPVRGSEHAGCWVLASGHHVHLEMDASGQPHPPAGPRAHPSCRPVPDGAGTVTYSRRLLGPKASPGRAFLSKRTLLLEVRLVLATSVTHHSCHGRSP